MKDCVSQRQSLPYHNNCEVSHHVNSTGAVSSKDGGKLRKFQLLVTADRATPPRKSVISNLY
ncbi:hypothetical protein DASC09_028360 [Saccharomycopsis crataegensis]|uniref:Uncharacterized protein n=1 Tax=Saccharomycopsis crataegensis TaxID=43959 RepID=A0AAV5QLI6_9ASCO|nr:hypothetical protein DASC09_028360 [Saccharomycopsis crataegensis]